MTERHTAWWRPGIRQAAKRDVDGAIYGLILATSVIAVSQQADPHNSGITAVTVIVTAGVFWLAHVYSGVLGIGLEERHMPEPAEIRRILNEEWPLVQAGILPTALLLLGPLGILADHTAQDVALYACLAELTAVGLVAARLAGGRGVQLVVSATISLSFGVVVIALKTIVH